MKKTFLMCFGGPVVSGFLVIGLLALSAGGLKADEFAYVLGNGGAGPYRVGTVDLNTGAYTSIGSISGTFVSGLGVSGGTLYTEAGGGFTLSSVNTSNASIATVGTGANGGLFGSTTTGLYGVDGQQDVYSINSLTGVTTVIGSTGLTPGTPGTALSTNASALYYAWNGGLYTINTTTGAASLVGNNLSQTPYALVYEAGTLYAGVDFCPNGSPAGCSFSIDTVNTSTGALTQGPTVVSVGAVQGLAPDPLSPTTTATPEPATITLVFGGAAAIIVLKLACR